jgi:hypothetical protein
MDVSNLNLLTTIYYVVYYKLIMQGESNWYWETGQGSAIHFDVLLPYCIGEC